MKRRSKRAALTAAVCLYLTAAAAIQAFASNVEGNTRDLSAPVASEQPEQGTWYSDSGKWYFRNREGNVCGRWACIASEDGTSDWYCFDGNGAMYTGWQKSSSGNWYYLREASDGRQGAMERGFILDREDGSCYYMDPGTGIMRTGWVYEGGYAYYFSESVQDVSWYWDSKLGKWRNRSAGRPYGAMYRNERTPDGYMTDGQGRRI